MSVAVRENLSDDFVAGNFFDKYRSSNPVHQWLMNGFLSAAADLVERTSPNNVLEAGCGPGDLAASLFQRYADDADFRYVGTDISSTEIEKARRAHSHFKFQEASICDLPFPDHEFDLVVACEVLEHLEDPNQAIAELARVTNRYALVSVPWEPTWRILNLIRGKYIGRLGNTPGHLQNFTRIAIRRLVSQHFSIVEERHPLPWTMFLLQRNA